MIDTEIDASPARIAAPASTGRRAIGRHGRRALPLRLDAADADAIEAAVDRTVAELGRLDILVNNAGIFPVGPIDELSLDDLDHTLDVHVRAAFVAARAASRHMVEGGRIITIGSSIAAKVPYAGVSLYAMSKAALTGLTKGLAHDLADRGITVNVVAPGSTDTEMNPADGELADDERALIPLGRYGRPEDVAGAVAFLAGHEAGHITGIVLPVDGGSTA